MERAKRLIITYTNYQKHAFEFIGEYMDKDDKFIYIRNPLVLKYKDDQGNFSGFTRMLPEHMPIDLLSQDGQSDLMESLDSISYAVLVSPENNKEVFDMYYDFFSKESEGVD